jgi:hypothetical protein
MDVLVVRARLGVYGRAIFQQFVAFLMNVILKVIKVAAHSVFLIRVKL